MAKPTSTRSRRWNPQSQVNRNHLSHMVRGGTPGYFQTLATGFDLLAKGSTTDALKELAPYVKEDIETFLGGANKATLEAAKATAANQVREELVTAMIAQGMDEATAREVAGL